MANCIQSCYVGATGRPFLSYTVEKILAERRPIPCYSILPMKTSRPALHINGLPAVAEDASPATTPGPHTTAKQPSARALAKLSILRDLRPPPFKHAWSFWHDKHSIDPNYEGRISLMLEDIISVKPFWEFFSNFPLEKLEQKDSVHFFKRGVKPVWEAPRNVKGGCWTFRVGKSNSKDFWMEVLLMAVGEQFTDIIQPGESDVHYPLLLFCPLCDSR